MDFRLIKYVLFPKRYKEIDNILIENLKEIVEVNVTPKIEYTYDLMKVGTLVHIDRPYTFDVVPQEFIDGLLFQGIHRAPKGLNITIKVKTFLKIYFIFHKEKDGGYVKIFKNLSNWKLCNLKLQYDIKHLDHGKKLLIYEYEAKEGEIISIPPTIKKNACFNILFQSNIKPPQWLKYFI